MNIKPNNRGRRTAALAVLAALGAGAAVAAIAAASSATPAYGASMTGGIGAAPDKTVASLIAPDGDRDPFGIAIVPLTMGKLTAGNLLVAEFGNKQGTAGAGTTILQVNPATGKTSVFFHGAPVAGPVGVAINPANDGVLDRRLRRGGQRHRGQRPAHRGQREDQGGLHQRDDSWRGVLRRRLGSGSQRQRREDQLLLR